MTALPTFVTEANALQVDVNNKQSLTTTSATTASTAATNAAASAAAAAASSNATIWVSGTTYSIGDCRFSPINFQTYRRKTAGAGTTDPSLDATNWAIQTVNGMVLIATLTPTAAAAVNALSIFTSTYDSYMIVADGIMPTSPGGTSLQMQFAVAGALDTAANYSEYLSSTAPAGQAIGGSSSMTISGGNISGATNYGSNLFLKITNVNSTTSGKMLTKESIGQTAAGTIYPIMGMDYYAPNSGANVPAVTGFGLFWSSGINFQAKGTIRVYGLQKV